MNRRTEYGMLAKGLLSAVVAVGLFGAAGGMGVQPPAKPAAKAPDKKDAPKTVMLIFRDGRTVTGTVVSENDSSIRIKGSVNKLSFETDYSKAEILEIKRDVEAPAAEEPKDGKGKDKPKADVKPGETAPPAGTEQKVYSIELTGKFGRDISQTPIREALADAKKNGVDVIVVTIDNEWALFNGLVERGNEESEVEDLFRAEDMDMIFSEEIRTWDKPPRLVFWVKKAMGGAAFLALVCPEIYFSSEAKLGGVGGLLQVLGGTGDEAFRNKQHSLRLAHAEGIARTGGYDYRLVKALAVTEYVLTVAFDGAKPVYFERMPEEGKTNEVLLTDDGKDERKDGNAALARGEGNDVLTLTAKLARDLQVSKGTVDKMEDLLFELGLARSGVMVKGRSDQIMKGWRDGVEKSLREIRRLLREASEVQIGGTYEERTRARGKIKGMYKQVQSLLTRYGEAFGKSQADGFKAQLNDRLNEIEQDQIRDNLNRRP